MIKIVLLKPESLIEKYWQVVQVLSIRKVLMKVRLQKSYAKSYSIEMQLGKVLTLFYIMKMWTEEENPPESTTFVIIGALTGKERYMWHFSSLIEC